MTLLNLLLLAVSIMGWNLVIGFDKALCERTKRIGCLFVGAVVFSLLRALALWGAVAALAPVLR